MKLLYPTNDLFIVQSRYAQNNFQGNSRWVIIQPGRKLFLGAIGKDCLPPVLEVLREASKEGVQAEEKHRSLIEKGVLSGKYCDDGSHGYLKRYHEFVRNYPFNDYSSPRRWHKDREQMAEYGKVAPPPPQYTDLDKHSGERVNLPIPLFRQVAGAKLGQGSDAVSVASAIATALAATFQATGSINGGDFGPWLRKACPSGGARHPTEAKLVLQGVDGIPDGSWLYDATRHQLVRDADVPRIDDLKQPGMPWVQWTFVSRVERPMWRYREARSMRPVLIDAGHVIRSVQQYLSALGYNLLRDDQHNLIEHFDFDVPTVATFSMTGPQLRQQPSTDFPSHSFPTPDQSISYATNPLIWLSVAGGHLRVHSDWPVPGSGCISDEEFRILNHCIPSKRGDRPSRPLEIADFLELANSVSIDRLVQSGWLIPSEMLRAVEPHIEKWCRSNWYLSLLAWTNIRACEATLRDISSQELNVSPEGSATLHTLRSVSIKRRTTRHFQDAPINSTGFRDLVDAIANSERFRNSSITGLIADFEGDHGTIYEIGKAANAELVKKGTVDRSKVLANGIGQFPLAKASTVLWLCAEANCADPALYCDNLLALGAIGQDICFHCAEADLGVFLTPAVVDDRTHEMLGLQADGDYFFYLFAFGYPATIGPHQHQADRHTTIGVEVEKETRIQLNAETGILISENGRVRKLPSGGAVS